MTSASRIAMLLMLAPLLVGCTDVYTVLTGEGSSEAVEGARIAATVACRRSASPADVETNGFETQEAWCAAESASLRDATLARERAEAYSIKISAALVCFGVIVVGALFWKRRRAQ